MDQAREEDARQLQHMMLSMMENQEELKQDMGLLLVNMEKFTEVMKTYQLVRTSSPTPAYPWRLVSAPFNRNCAHTQSTLPRTQISPAACLACNKRRVNYPL